MNTWKLESWKNMPEEGANRSHDFWNTDPIALSTKLNGQVNSSV